MKQLMILSIFLIELCYTELSLNELIGEMIAVDEAVDDTNNLPDDEAIQLPDSH